jgi:hypothetical protein
LALLSASSWAQTALPSIKPLSLEKTAVLCAELEHASECGRAVERELISTHALKNLLNRDGKKLSLSLANKSSKVFEDSGDEVTGQRFSFFAYYAEADAVALYRTLEDKVDYLLVARDSGKTFRLPSDPLFDKSSKRFFTLDHCVSDCEQKLALWEINNGNYKRTQELSISSRWNEVSAQWLDDKRIELTLIDARDKQVQTLTLGDSKWKTLP